MASSGNDTLQGQSSHATVWPIALAITAIGIGLRLYRWTADELWPDEAFLGYVSGLPLSEILSLTWMENTPPLAHYLVAISERMFGPGEAALRLPSLIGGSLLAPATFLAGRRFFGDRAGLFAAWIVALSPIHIFYSQIARAYALLPLLALGSAVALYYLTDRIRRLDVALYSLVTAAAIYTHQWGALLVPAAYLYVLLARIPGGAKRVLIGHGIAFVLCLPLVPSLRPNPAQVDIVRSFYDPVWASTPPALAIPKSLEVLWAGGRYPTHTTKKLEMGDRRLRARDAGLYGKISPWVWRIGCWLSLGYLLLTGLLPVRDDVLPAGGRKGKRRLLAIFLLGPLGIAWIVSLVITPIYLVGRHDVMLLPFVALLAGLGAAKLRRPVGGAAMAFYTILVATSLVPFYLVTYSEGNRERAGLLSRRVRQGDVVIYTGYR
ncbi:MAG: glycosyltransferase family 39 protein, partial [Planctomycetota bacterium]|nr:glycosyltransferase family 39 protein [Planctomycetota bacterium]